MKILHLAAGSTKSGAFKGTYLLHQNLLKFGVKSLILNNSNINNIKGLKQTYSINSNFFENFKINFLYFFDRFPKILFFKRKNTSFSNNFFSLDITKSNYYNNADIIHFHWINRGFIDLSLINKIDKPIVWTLRDMWPFTGGCHYTLGCNNFIKGCSKCPQLGSNFKYDISYFLFQKKKKNLKKKNIYFCTISKWLADSAKKSAILKKEKILNMNNHVDTKNFYPLSKKISRKKLKINTNKKIIIYGAENIEAKYKGYDKFIDTLDYLNSKEYMILIFGKMWNFSKLREKKIEFKYLGYVSNKNKLRTIYNAGDLFAISSLQDAFPKTFAEAMLCEVPIVSFKNTSIAKVNLHKKTGYNAKGFDPKDFAKGISYVAKKKNLGKKGRKLILQKYNPNLITKNYINLYKKILHEKK